MTIVCKVCKYEIRSMKPSAEAVEHLLKTLLTHLGACHHEHAEALALAQMRFIGLVGGFLAFGYAEIPASEPALAAAYQQAKQEIESILASEPIIGKIEAPIASGGPIN